MIRAVRAGEAGFSLIEALVALTIAAMALLAIYALQQQLASGQLRNERALGLVVQQRNAMALLGDLNPMDAPAGELPLAGGGRLRWTAAPLTEAKTQIGEGGAGEGRYLVRLYRVRAVILGPRGEPRGRLEFDRLGWRARAPDAPQGR